MNKICGTNELFYDSWDLSMSTVLNNIEDENKLSCSSRMLLDEAERIESLLTQNTFFGLPNKVKTLICKYKGIDKLYDWQIDCLNIPTILTRQNLLFSLPTSGGKTLVAEILMFKELLIQKKNVIFVLPYVALAQEKVRSLAPFGLDLEFYVEEYVGGKGKYPPQKHHKKRSVYVCTIEKAAGLVDSLLDSKRLNEVGMMVVDEIHLIGDCSRGPVLEIMLAKLMFATKNVHIVAMSATVGNLNEIGEFLKAHVYTHNFRPVELIQYVKCENQVYKIERDIDGTCSFCFDRNLNFNYSRELLNIDPGYLGGLVQEVIPNDSCLVFCATKKLCSNFALLICQTMKKSVTDMKQKEKLALLRALAEEGQGVVCPVLKRTLPYGVAYHHSGLTNAEKKLLEEAFMAKTISCICCTSTLAAGINLPAKRVIITSPYVGKDFMKLSTYKQMSGRAGRTGLSDKGESFLMCQDSDRTKILDLLKSAMDRCDSKMKIENFIRLAMNAIGLQIANTKTSLKSLFGFTLFCIQSDEKKNQMNDELVDDLVNKSIDRLTSLKAIKESSETEEYSLTLIANAAMAGNLDMTEAQLICSDLEQAVDDGLVLSSYLHLFYLLTPYSAVEELKIDRQVTISVISDLSPTERKIAEHIGITEVCLIQYVKTGKVTVIPDIIWNRFLRSLIIFDLWSKKSIWEVSKKFEIPRGTIHNFLMRTAAFASSVQRFTEASKMEKFENFPALIQKIIPRISYCCTSELLQLMQLPAVKIGRAKQLYKVGYRTLQDLVNADPVDLVAAVDHLPRRVAYEIIAAAKLLMLEKAETLQEEADSIKADLNDNKNNADISFSEIENLPDNRFSTPQVRKTLF